MRKKSRLSTPAQVQFLHLWKCGKEASCQSWLVGFIKLEVGLQRCDEYTAKRIGCFKHWMVTLVADKLRRQWLWEIITLAIDPKLYLTTDNLNICEGVTTIIIWHLYKLATHRCSVVTIIICKIMVVIACFLIQAGVTPSSVVKDCTILVVTLPMFL